MVEIELKTISDSDIGQYLVGTASGSAYVLDLDERKMLWASHEVCGDIDGLLHLAVEATIIAIARCRIGEPMVLLVGLPVPGLAPTKWTSSVVAVIEALPSPGSEHD